MDFFAELKRRNVVRMAGLYLVGAWLIVQVAGTLLPMFDAPVWVARVIVLLLAIGFFPAVIFAWAFELTPSGLQRDEKVKPEDSIAPQTGRRMDRIIIAVLVLALGYFAVDKIVLAPRRDASLVAETQKSLGARPAAEANAKSIAVLPFADMSPGKDQEYFADGISEELLNALVRVEGLRVVARTSSFSFKGKSVGVEEIAQKLGVQHILEGSLRRDGNRIRITAQLINARDGFHLWSETFERELQGVFAVQDEITRAIVAALRVKLALAASPVVPANSEAYELYLRGLYFSNKTSEGELRQALALFQQTLEKDPSFSRAWTGMAKVWIWLADEYVKPLEAYPAAEAAAKKALALNPKDAEARCHLAEAKWVLHWNLAEAEAEAERALRDDPNSAAAHFLLAHLKPYNGDLTSALVHSRAAIRLDPLSVTIRSNEVALLIRSHRLDEALVAAQRTAELDPNFRYGSPVARVYLAQGRFEEALALYRKDAEQTHQPSTGLAISYAALGRAAEARDVLRQLIEKAQSGYVRPEGIARIYAALGEREEAFSWLEKAYKEHSSSLSNIVFQSELQPLQSDPRFADLLRRIGIDPAKVLNPQTTP